MLRHAVPAVRPDDVLSGLAAVTGLASTGAPLLTRLAQGPLDEATGEIGDPLDRPTVTDPGGPCAILAVVAPDSSV